jgi:hypothetical protein
VAQRVRYENIGERYLVAHQAYRSGWRHVDDALAEAFATCSGFSMAEVFTKVVLIDGVYRAQLPRTLGENADRRAATAITGSRRAIAAALRRLSVFNSPTEAACVEAARVHSLLLRVLRGELGTNRDAVSFASKYLHFHAPDVVPIYNQYAAGQLPRFSAGYRGARAALKALGHGDGVDAT